MAISLADPGGEAVLEPGPGETPLWPDVVLSALLPAGTAQAAVRAALSRLPEFGSGGIAFSFLAERDWVGEFREQLSPRRYGERLWICPPGMPCPDAAGLAVVLEPGLDFGSGSHPTTALCLTWLAAQDLLGRTVLDWGCGSGVLALAALALGARAATGVDIDPQALAATAENARRNGRAGQLRAAAPQDIETGARHDLVVANILADSLIALAPSLQRHAPGAPVALSGILAAQARRVCDACAPWLDLHLTAGCDGWVLLAGTSRANGP